MEQHRDWPSTIWAQYTRSAPLLIIERCINWKRMQLCGDRSDIHLLWARGTLTSCDTKPPKNLCSLFLTWMKCTSWIHTHLVPKTAFLAKWIDILRWAFCFPSLPVTPRRRMQKKGIITPANDVGVGVARLRSQVTLGVLKSSAYSEVPLFHPTFNHF